MNVFTCDTCNTVGIVVLTNSQPMVSPCDCVANEEETK